MATTIENLKQSKWPHKEQAEGTVFTVSDTFAFGVTTQSTLFTMPENSMLMELIVQPETAWVSNDIGIFFDDSGSNVLMEIKGLQSGLGQTTTALSKKMNRNFTASTAIRVNHWGTPTAGACKVWAVYRLNTNVPNPMGGNM
jgi:hypothetical protein